MKKLLLLFVLISSLSKAQCNASTFSPATICYPAQTKTIAASMATDIIYLCGSGSVVYDTLNPSSLKVRQVFVNPGATYHYKSTLTNNQVTVYAKAGSTVIIYPGTITTFAFNYIKEAGATMNNLSTNTITTTSCSVITGPTINCSVTAVTSVSQNETQTNVWPNPAHDKIYVSTEFGKDKSLSIINILGEVVYSQKVLKEEKQEISLSSFTSGIYYVIIRSADKTETKKIVVTK